MPRPRSITPAHVADAALTVLDRDGLARLSMRSVGHEVGMGTMSLYRYVRDREDLERLVVDLLFSSLDATTSPRASWRTRIVRLLGRFHAIAAAHPEAVPLLVAHRFTSGRALPWAEAVFAALSDAGLDARQRFHAFRLLTSYLIGSLEAEHLSPSPRNGTALAVEAQLESYPLLAANASYARTVPAEDVFRQGLELLLDGIARSAARAGPST